MSGYTARDRSPGQLDLKGSFECDGTNAPLNLRGTGFTVSRTGVGIYLVTVANPPDTYEQYDSILPGLAGTGIGGYTIIVTAQSPKPASGGATFEVTIYNAAGTAADIDGPRVNFHVAFRNWSMF